VSIVPVSQDFDDFSSILDFEPVYPASSGRILVMLNSFGPELQAQGKAAQDVEIQPLSGRFIDGWTKGWKYDI
jgi:hypothetical protein